LIELGYYRHVLKTYNNSRVFGSQDHAIPRVYLRSYEHCS
jgi:hypothetical protein